MFYLQLQSKNYLINSNLNIKIVTIDLLCNLYYNFITFIYKTNLENLIIQFFKSIIMPINC